MAYTIGSYGQQPQDLSFGLPTDPMAQQGMLAAMRSMQPTMALMQQPRAAQAPQQGAPASSGGQTPLNGMLFGQNGNPGSSGVIGNGGFSNTVGNWMDPNYSYAGQSVPAQAQYGKPPVPDAAGETATPSPTMAPPPPLQMPTAAPAASGGGGGMGGSMMGMGGGGSSGGGSDILSLLMSLLA